MTFQYSQGEVDILWMKQIFPTFGNNFDKSKISDVLTLDEMEIDERFPVQDVSTGTPSFIVPLKTLDSVKKARIDKDKYFNFIKDTEAKGILIFCPETYKKDNDLNVRFFADYYGVPEDPATGSANGCLAGYLVKNRYFGEDKIDIRVEQGYEIGRPSLLFLRAEEIEGKIDVYVGGKVMMIAKGEFL